MLFMVRVLMGLVAKIKSLGFLEWAGISAIVETLISATDIKQEIYGIITDEMASRAGLHLDRSDPFSQASVAGAVSQRVGFPVRSLSDPQMMREDVDNHISRSLSQKSGYQVRSVTDQAVLRQDLMRIGAAQVSAKLGIPLGVIAEDGNGDFDPVAVKNRLLAWAKAELLANLNNEVKYAVGDIMARPEVDDLFIKLQKATETEDGVTYPVTREQCAMLLARGAGPNSENEIAALVAGTLAVKAVVEFQQQAREWGKLTRRREQLRAAQAKFRHIHGNRQKYIPLGLTADFS